MSQTTKLKCECLFCQNQAVARFTAPQHKPRFLICEGHLEEMLTWAAPYRNIVGAVTVERMGA